MTKQQWQDMKRKSQAALILDHLQHGGGITPLGALHMFDCLRLSGRILELRRAGWNIKTEMITMNTGKSVAYYTLDKNTPVLS